MKIQKMKFATAAALIGALVFGTAAEAANTFIVTSGGYAVSTMQAGDTINASATADVDFQGTSSGVTRQVSRTQLGINWSGDSLQLKDENSIIHPEGWDLQYSTDGTTWSGSAPSDRSTIVGVKSAGDIAKTSPSNFQSTTTALLMANAADFSAGSGGDGFNVTFAGDRVYNVYHHAATIQLDCHLKATGDSCYGAATNFAGYSTPNSSQGFWHASDSKMFVPVMRNSDKKAGIACINLAVLTAPALCSTPFVALGQTNSGTNMSGPAQVGSKLFMPNPHDWDMLCFDMETAAACTSNGWLMGDTDKVRAVGGTLYGRASNIGGKVFFSTKNNLGCFDPVINDRCVGSSPVAISGQPAPQFPMFSVKSTTGVLLGACFFSTQQCLDTAGLVTTTILPAALATWMTAHPLPSWNTYDAGQAGEWNNRIYFPVGPSGSATNDIYCFSFTTSLACASFVGTNAAGANIELYSIQADPEQSNCLWTNGNNGRITTLNASTGQAGCASATATVRLPYEKILPRLACAESGRIKSWGTVIFNSPGISASVLRVSINDTNGNPIAGFTDMTVTESSAGSEDGTLDLSALTVAMSGTKPTIMVTASIEVAGSLLALLTAQVGFTADNPELCVVLIAKSKCTNAHITAQGDLSVANGTITSRASVSSVGYGPSSPIIYSEQVTTNTQTITGTNTATLCGATASSGVAETPTVSPVVKPVTPTVKRPPVAITIGGFRDGSPVLTPAIKAAIKKFMLKYHDYKNIETIGYTEGPTVLKTDFALSKKRAVNALGYVSKTMKMKMKVVAVKANQNLIEASKVRRIRIILTD